MNNINLFDNKTNLIQFEVQEPKESSSDDKIAAISFQTIENNAQASSLSDHEFLGSMEQFSSRSQESSLISTTFEEAISDLSFDFFDNATPFPSEDLEPSLSLPTYSTSTETIGTDQNMDSQIEETALQTSAVSIPTLLPKLSVAPSTRKRKWSEEETAYLSQLYYEKLSYKEIANQLNRTNSSCSRKITELLSNGSLNKELSNNGEKIDTNPAIANAISRSVEELKTNSKKPWTPEETNQLVQMYEDGFTYNQIGEILGKTRFAVDNKIRKFKKKNTFSQEVSHTTSVQSLPINELKATPANPWEKEETDQLVQLYYQGLPYNEIAKTLNRTKSSITNKIHSLILEKMISQRVNRAPSVQSRPINKLEAKPNVPWSKEQSDQLVQLYHDGLTYSAIGRSLGRTVDAVENKLRMLKKQNIIPQGKRPKRS